MNKNLKEKMMNQMKAKQRKFLELMETLRKMVVYDNGKVQCQNVKEQWQKFNEYIDELPQDKAREMRAMRNYRNHLANSIDIPDESARIDAWIKSLEEHIKNIKQK
jgi:hypothetical protein